MLVRGEVLTLIDTKLLTSPSSSAHDRDRKINREADDLSVCVTDVCSSVTFSFTSLSDCVIAFAFLAKSEPEHPEGKFGDIVSSMMANPFPIHYVSRRDVKRSFKIEGYESQFSYMYIGYNQRK